MQTTTPKAPSVKNKDCLKTVWEAINLVPWITSAEVVHLTGLPIGAVIGRLAELEDLDMASSKLKRGKGSGGAICSLRHYASNGPEYVKPTLEMRYATRTSGEVKAVADAVSAPVNTPPTEKLADSPVTLKSATAVAEPLKTINFQEIEIDQLPLSVARLLYRQLHDVFGASLMAA